MAGPGRGVVIGPGVDQRRLLAAEPRGRGLAARDGVGAAGDALESSEADLVAQQVSQGLGRGEVVEDVAVVVQPGVQVAQGQRAVPPKDRAAGRPHRAAGDRAGVRLGWGEGPLADAGRSPALVVGHDRPEAFAALVEAGEDLEAAGGEGVDLVVDEGELGEEVLALGVQPSAGDCGQAGPEAVVEQATAGDPGEPFGATLRPRWCRPGRELGVGLRRRRWEIGGHVRPRS